MSGVLAVNKGSLCCKSHTVMSDSEHYGLLSMRYLTKLVANAVVLCTGVLPLFASVSCTNTALPSACCKPDCPMMVAMSHAAKVKSTDKSESSVVNQCEATSPSSISFTVPETSAKSPISEALSEVVLDLQPPAVLARSAHAFLRADSSLQRPRSSLCIFRI